MRSEAYLALERARKTMEGFITSTTTGTRRDPLAARLLPTAKLWLDVLEDEERKLAEAQRENPQIEPVFHAGLPLDPDRPEQRALFKGRTDIGRLVAHHLDEDRRGVLVVVGQRRMGKSSLRNFLPRLLGGGTEVVPVNFQELSGHPHRTTPHRWVLELVARQFPGRENPPETTAWADALAWLKARDAELADHRLLVVVDEVERVEDGIRDGWCTADFLDFLRAAGDALTKIRFLLLTAYPLPRLGRHWNDRLISATSRFISYLDPVSAEELMRSPVESFPDIYPTGGVERILKQTHCHPFLLQKVGDELCEFLNAHHRQKATDDELTDIFDRVAREPLFDELWDQRTPDERRALHALACAREPLDATPAMRALEREGYVVLDRDERASIAVPLFSAWIRRTQGRVLIEQGPEIPSGAEGEPEHAPASTSRTGLS